MVAFALLVKSVVLVNVPYGHRKSPLWHFSSYLPYLDVIKKAGGKQKLTGTAHFTSNQSGIDRSLLYCCAFMYITSRFLLGREVTRYQDTFSEN